MERKIYHAAKYSSFLFYFLLDRTWRRTPRLKVDRNHDREGQRKRSSGFFLLFFYFNGVSCVNLTWLESSEVINDCIYFFILVRGRRQLFIPFEQTFIDYVIDDSYNESYKSQPEDERKMNRVHHDLLILAKTVCSDDGKKSFFSDNRNGLMLFSSILFVVPLQAKETIDRASNELHRWTFEIRAIFLSRRRVKTSDKHSILLLTFFRSVSKIWCHQEPQTIHFLTLIKINVAVA